MCKEPQIFGFIQNRRDAPLLVQWGEGDFQILKSGYIETRLID